MPKVYLSGPMRGYPNFNFPAFDAARDRAKAFGWEPISPADVDRAAGIDESTPGLTFDGPEAARVFAERDTRILLDLRAERGDAIAMLDGWAASTGARAEFFLAAWLGLTVLDANTMQPWDVSDRGIPGLQIARGVRKALRHRGL